MISITRLVSWKNQMVNYFLVHQKTIFFPTGSNSTYMQCLVHLLCTSTIHISEQNWKIPALVTLKLNCYHLIHQ